MFHEPSLPDSTWPMMKGSRWEAGSPNRVTVDSGSDLPVKSGWVTLVVSTVPVDRRCRTPDSACRSAASPRQSVHAPAKAMPGGLRRIAQHDTGELDRSEQRTAGRACPATGLEAMARGMLPTSEEPS